MSPGAAARHSPSARMHRDDFVVFWSATFFSIFPTSPTTPDFVISKISALWPVRTAVLPTVPSSRNRPEGRNLGDDKIGCCEESGSRNRPEGGSLGDDKIGCCGRFHENLQKVKRPKKTKNLVLIDSV